MSVNNDTQTGESATIISADAATRVQRKAEARQHSEDVPVGIPEETEVDGENRGRDSRNKTRKEVGGAGATLGAGWPSRPRGRNLRDARN